MGSGWGRSGTPCQGQQSLAWRCCKSVLDERAGIDSSDPYVVRSPLGDDSDSARSPAIQQYSLKGVRDNATNEITRYVRLTCGALGVGAGITFGEIRTYRGVVLPEQTSGGTSVLALYETQPSREGRFVVTEAWLR